MKSFDAIIVGGSYSGLAAAMALGRALKNVLIIDSGKPCNRQTPRSHNFLTNDGKTPTEIASIAKRQVSQYPTIQFFDGLVISASRLDSVFEVRVETNQIFVAKKIIFATGIEDLLPTIEGISACWGISVLHCPYCHGYEVRNEKTAILGNGDSGFDLVRLISNWTKDLTLLTNGDTQLTGEQAEILQNKGIRIMEEKLVSLEQDHGELRNIVFSDGSKFAVKVLYAPQPFEQQSKIPAKLGCNFTKEGYILVDTLQQTSVEGIYACGDNSNPIRTVANAVASGTTAGIALSKKMILDEFY